MFGEEAEGGINPGCFERFSARKGRGKSDDALCEHRFAPIRSGRHVTVSNCPPAHSALASDMSNYNFSVSIEAAKAESLKQWAKDQGLDVEDQGPGYRIKNFSTGVRPQKHTEPQGQWTVICPPDAAPAIGKLLDDCPNELS